MSRSSAIRFVWFRFQSRGSANGNRTRISALKGPRANRCTIAPRVFRFSEFNVLPLFYQSPHEPSLPRNCVRYSQKTRPRYKFSPKHLRHSPDGRKKPIDAESTRRRDLKSSQQASEVTDGL